MKTRLGLIAALCVLSLDVAVVNALSNGLCLTPPMGWNSWNWFGCHNSSGHGELNEAMVKSMADAMVSSGMKDAGYHYINLDDCWAESSRDSHGGLVPGQAQFPSGMRSLASYVHGKGLGLGIYTDVASRTCAGAMPGAYQHEQQDADSFVAWGIDYLKYDYCGASGSAPASYSLMRNSLHTAMVNATAQGNTAAHEIAYSICDWGQQSPWTWGDTIGNLWRTTQDISADYYWIQQLLVQNMDFYPYAGPGGWNDADMLEVGNGLTAIEDKTQFSLWCMIASPLIAGNDIRSMSATTKAILTNSEMIVVNQDSLGLQGRRVVATGAQFGGTEVWVKKLKNDDIAVCFNNDNDGAAATNIIITWQQIGTALGMSIGAATTLYARNLWAVADGTPNLADLGQIASGYTAKAVPRHGVFVMRLSSRPISAPGTGAINRVARARKADISVKCSGAMLAIEGGDSRIVSARLIDLRGVEVLSVLGSRADQPISLQNIPAGMYVLRIQTGNESLSLKLVTGSAPLSKAMTGCQD